MNSNEPPYTITDEILGYVASISEKLGGMAVRARMEMRPHLRRDSRIQSIHASLRIEANALSLGQVRDVIDGKPVLGEAREIQEVKNAYEAYERLPDIDPYSLRDLQRLHGVMTKYLVDESGVFRHGEEGVFSGERCIFIAPPARLVPTLMDHLFSWMQRSKGKVHPLILSAVFHYEFVFIHPFADGNGRMARLWHTALLAQWHPLFLYLPLESQIEKFQEDYYNAISACHRAGESTAFIAFILSQIDKLLDALSEQWRTEEAGMDPLVQRLLDMMDSGEAYTSAQLMARLGLKSREGFRKNYLRPALAQGVIERTIPDKPSSRNQRYRRK